MGLSRREFPELLALRRKQSVCACPQTLGVLASCPGAGAGVRFGLCPAPVGMLKAARSAGLRRGLQVSPARAPAWETTAHPYQEVVAVGRVLTEKLLATGGSVGTVGL